MGLALFASTISPVLAISLLLHYLEQRQYWTLRLYISRYLHGYSLLALYGVLISKVIYDVQQWRTITQHAIAKTLSWVLKGSVVDPVIHVLAVTAFAFVVLVSGLLLTWVFLPLIESKTYLSLRWKAWSGPSRTGIAPGIARYVGSRNDWQALQVQAGSQTKPHPAERFLSLIAWIERFRGGNVSVVVDPTDLLKAQLALDEESDTIWIPGSREKESVYAPTPPDRAVSLLWGPHLGFVPRCGRGIIAVPTYLLTMQPKLESGVDGRPICLAHGILGRNKGLDPHRLVCGLRTPESQRQFEENSSLWPMPAKTLYSLYHAEMAKSFHGIGENYVSAATQLALIIADQRQEIIEDWLRGTLEQQDLAINQEIARLGADDGDLARLYQGQYAAMLVSLSEHRLGMRRRPEILVYEAMLAREGVTQRPAWLSDSLIRRRREEEFETYGAKVLPLIEALML